MTSPIFPRYVRRHQNATYTGKPNRRQRKIRARMTRLLMRRYGSGQERL